MGIFSEDDKLRIQQEMARYLKGEATRRLVVPTAFDREEPAATTYDDILLTMRAIDTATKRLELEMRTPLQFYCRPEDEERTRELVELARDKVYAESNYQRPVRPVRVIPTGVPNAIPPGQILMIDPVNWSTE